MKRVSLIFILVGGFLLSLSTHAALLRTEQFVGYDTANLGATSTSGTLNGWNMSTAEITLTNGSGSLDGKALGLVASEGDRAFISAYQGASAVGARNQFVANSTFPQGNETNVYYSFLCQFRNAADVSTEGEYLAQVNRANSGIGTPQHWNLVAKNVGGQIQLGLAKAGAPSNATNYAPTTVAVGQTVFVVVRQHILPGTQNDVYDLWINPPAQYFGTNEVDVPVSDATIGTVPEDGTEDASGTGPGRFVIFAGANAEVDELRFATTWAEATPPVGQCNGAGVTADPVSVTQSAEINAAFKVAVSGTSPTIQWQLSTDGGGTWNDIAGAVASTYTTPNLAMTDNGNRYRALVSVLCNHSTATSGVAVVTLTNPVVTPVSVVMNDTFLDTDLIGYDDRSNPPISETNSIWYTVNTDSLSAYGQGGNMVATPSAGGSSLWLGYFVDTNLPPVHLAVGRTLRVTLPFTPTAFTAFTNNAGLRLGLYDYYDGGTRVTSDGSAAGGSSGNGNGVRGYMLNLDFGATFSVNSPVQLLARSFLPDNNLMGTVADYESLGSGPAGGGYVGAAAFQAGTEYTLVFTVARTAESTVDITATVSGGGTNWSHKVTDAKYAYHRFDAFGIRPNSLETSADSFIFPEFKVEVLQGAISVPPFKLTAVQALSSTAVKLTWDSVSGATYHVLAADSLSAGTWTTNGTVVATSASTSYTNTPIASGVTARFYRVLAPPYTP